jgi:hypothetical protein
MLTTQNKKDYSLRTEIKPMSESQILIVCCMILYSLDQCGQNLQSPTKYQYGWNYLSRDLKSSILFLISVSVFGNHIELSVQ